MTSARNIYPKTYYPFSDELCNFMDANPDFLNALKLSNTSSFEFIPLVFTSHLPHWHRLAKDEVIGMWYLDKKRLKKGDFPIFKQDFVVNKGTKNKYFNVYVDKVTFGKLSQKREKNIYLINYFFRDYGENGVFYHRENLSKPWMHHYDDVKDLPDEPNLRFLATVIKIKNSPQPLCHSERSEAE